MLINKSILLNHEKLRVTVDDSFLDGSYFLDIYTFDGEPGTEKELYQILDLKKENEIDLSILDGLGQYKATICKKGSFKIQDECHFEVKDADPTAYIIKNASYQISNNVLSINIESDFAKEVTYYLYWSNNHQRLSNYTYLKKIKSNDKNITVHFENCLFMPGEADEIEIYIINGSTSSYFLKIDDSLKLNESKFLYSFQVITDLHIESKEAFPAHTSHLRNALKTISQLSKNSVGIFTCGDNTNHGKDENYQFLNEITEEFHRYCNLPIYYSLGNHEYIFGTDYDYQISLHKKYLPVPGVYYSFVKEGSSFIFMGSDSIKGEGTMNEEHVKWLENELVKADSSKPIYIFLHQPLIETVSGSLYSINPKVQFWYGIDSGIQIKKMLENYPNAILFTGHTHWTFDSIQPVLYEKGKHATYINCASVGYLWNDNDTHEPGSEGMFVEVYEDYILLRGREFVENKWCAVAQFKIER